MDGAVPKPAKPPTVKTVARHLAALQKAMAHVYGDSKVLERTNEFGTIRVEWRSGPEVMREALRGEGERDAKT